MAAYDTLCWSGVMLSLLKSGLGVGRCYVVAYQQCQSQFLLAAKEWMLGNEEEREEWVLKGKWRRSDLEG